MTDADADSDAGATSETNADSPGDATGDDPTTRTVDGIVARYYETDEERLLAFDRDGQTAAVAQNRDGYAMLKVRTAPDGDELERYYGFDMALDHAAERLGVDRHDLPVPDPAADMGM